MQNDHDAPKTRAQRRIENKERFLHISRVKAGILTSPEDIRLANEYEEQFDINRKKKTEYQYKLIEDIEERTFVAETPTPILEPDPPPEPMPLIVMDPSVGKPVKRGRGRPPKERGPHPHETPPKKATPPVGIPYATTGAPLTDRQKLKLLDLIREARDRKYETLRLYRPLPVQAEFHMSDAHICILRGGNRSGKTAATMTELAWALTGTHPKQGKYPTHGLRAIVVAKNMDKIGEVIWRYLGRPGSFKMTDDPETGEPRIERPGDREAGLVMRPAPPLIPRRLLNLNRDVTWESKRSMIPRKLIIPSLGNECSFYSGQADPFSIQGTNLDLVCFDEEIEHEGWFSEAIARLVDRGGRLIWGATPQTGTQKLYELHMKSQEDEELGVENPLVKEFVLSIYDNPFITDEDRAMFLASLDDEDQIKVRIEGEHAVAGFKIFNSYFFPRGVHGVAPFPIPDNWTRFIAIDPGAQVAAAVFCTCPPKTRPRGEACDLPEDLFGDFIYIYDEIYIRRCDATKLAREIKDHIGSQTIHTILLDHHGGSLTEIGTGRTPEQQYKEAFQKYRVPMPLVGRYFTYGSDDLNGGILRIKEFLRLREDGTPKLKIMSGRCPQLVSALSRYQWKVVSGVITDKPLAKNCDSVDCLRYLCMHPGVQFKKSGEKSRKRLSCYEEFQEWQSREKSRKKKKVGHGITL